MKQLFEITRRSPLPVRSLVTPASPATRGQAFQESATAGTAELADGTKPFAGFITRNSQVGGPVLGDVIYPGRLELPFETGFAGSFEYAEEIEAEGTTFIDTASQYGAITTGTALGTELTFNAGKLSVATSGKKGFLHDPRAANAGERGQRAHSLPGGAQLREGVESVTT